MYRKHHVNPPLSIYKKIALTFIILTVILIGVIFYFTLTYAYITIYPKQDEVKTDFNFAIVEDDKAISPEQGIFQGKIVEQIIQGEKLFVTTGKKQIVGDTVGEVKIINNLAKTQTLVATTRLLTADNILYRLKTRVDIPAKGSAVVAVYPDDAAKPLAKAGAKFTIPGLSQSVQELVYAENSQDFMASGQFVAAISQEELDKAVADYSDELAQQALTAEDKDKTKVLSKEILEKSFDQKAGDEDLNYHLTLKIKVSGVIFTGQAIKDYAVAQLNNLVTQDKQLVSNTSDQLVYEIKKLDFTGKIAQIKSSVSGTEIISQNSPILNRDKFVKLNQEDIQSYLGNFQQIERTDVSFFPVWAKKAPYFQDHIIIKIAQ
ncbi:MAG: hypothetical protein WC460_01350 [Patescibacteria group bacterium]